MLRVTTLHAGSAAATARYYTRYLAAAPGEEPGEWLGKQAAGLGLTGVVSADALELLLSGRDPATGMTLGFPLQDRTRSDGTVIRAVSGFDATLSAPKSVSVWWALTGDPGIAECHDVAARAVVECIERIGSTTRIRSNGRRLHPDSQGLTVAGFRQTTSRLDDPQLHTHLVISAKVQTGDGRWLALDARVLKRYQRALGGLYQSVLRAELTSRYGVGFDRIVNGTAEIAGVPDDLLELFSKRAAQVRAATDVGVDEFRRREGRYPSRFEQAALERQAAADTRGRKTGHAVPDLRTRWRKEAADIGLIPESLTRSITDAARIADPSTAKPTVTGVIAGLSETRSAWHRMDALRAVTDQLRPQPGMNGARWAAALDRAVDRVIDGCVDLDPVNEGVDRRVSDGRSPWIEPVAAQVTSRQVLAQEETILVWALDTPLVDPQPSPTVDPTGLDVLQAGAAAAVAGNDNLVVIVGPAGAGKSTMLHAAVADLHTHGRHVFGLAPTAKAARVLERETGIIADTVAKLLVEWDLPGGPRSAWHLPHGTTVVVDEAGMLSTPDLYRLTRLATSLHWRLALVGDPRQLQAVGRGGMFTELAATVPTIELERIHRFTRPWEAAASLRLRHGDPQAFDAYQNHGRIIPGTFDEHLDTIAKQWIRRHAAGDTLAITTTTNDHVDAINQLIQQRRIDNGHLDPARSAPIGGGEHAHVGDVVATRRNNRDLHTTTGDIVRNRELWTVTHIADTGELTVTRNGGPGNVTLPADYAGVHVRLGYAATEHGNQSDTQTASITLATPATTGRGLYVAITRGRDDNTVHVITDTHNSADARAVLETIIATDRADIPATTQRRNLATQDHSPPRLQPRSRIPDWYPHLHAQATAIHWQAQQDLDEARENRGLRVAGADQAAARLDRAEQACIPFDAERATATAALTRCENEQRTATLQLDQTGLRGRRKARGQLAVADHAVVAARRDLAACEQRSSGPATERAAARQALEHARDEIRNHDLLDRWRYLPEHLHTAQHQLDALNTWHEWATGKPVPTNKLTNAAATLNRARNLAGAPELGDLLPQKADRNRHPNVSIIQPAQATTPHGLER